MIRKVISVIGLLAALGATAREARQMNVVILLTDDQGYGDLHCYGNPKVRTPNIDRLASEGTLFTDFYAGAAASTPSRGALLTGRYAERVGVPDVVDDTSLNGLNPGELTIADYLKQHGYATGMFGKWHLGYQPEYMPVRHGFDEFYGLPYSMDMWPFHPAPSHNYRPLPLYSGEEVVEYNPPVNEMTTRLTEKAVDFIGRHADEPFFLWWKESATADTSSSCPILTVLLRNRDATDVRANRLKRAGRLRLPFSTSIRILTRRTTSLKNIPELPAACRRSSPISRRKSTVRWKFRRSDASYCFTENIN